jgi:hypothetical protein
VDKEQRFLTRDDHHTSDEVSSLKFNSHDIAVIEYALQSAVQYETSKPRKAELQEVLEKFRENVLSAMQLKGDSRAEDYEKSRYDYDDLVEHIYEEV